MKKKEFIAIDDVLEFLHSKGYNDDKHVIDQIFKTGSFDFKNYHLSVNPFLNDEEEEKDDSGIAVRLSLGIGIALTLAVVGFVFCKGLELLVKFGVIVP